MRHYFSRFAHAPIAPIFYAPIFYAPFYVFCFY